MRDVREYLYRKRSWFTPQEPVANTVWIWSQNAVSHIHEHFRSARVGKVFDEVASALRRLAQFGVDGDASEEGDLNYVNNRLIIDH